MVEVVVRNILRFVGLVLLQVLILNNVQLGGYLNPYLYVLIILSLPIETPRWLTLFIGFITGLSIDLFTHTLGMHTTATVFLAFCRPIVLQYIAPRDGYEFGIRASVQDMGFVWYLSYAAILVGLHHFFLFFVEAFTASHFWFTFGKVILSSLLTLLLVIVFQYLGYQRKLASP